MSALCMLCIAIAAVSGKAAHNSATTDLSANKDTKHEQIVSFPLGINSTSRAVAMDLRNAREVKIELVNASVTPFGIAIGAARPLYGGDFSGSGVWYVVATPDTLYSVDTTSGVLTLLGQITGIPLPVGSNTSGLTWDYSTNTMYMCNLSGGIANLYTLNLSTRVATPIGPILTGTIIDIACSNTGQLYGIKFATAAGVSDSLVSINKTTGAGTTVGPLGVDINFAHGLDFDPVSDSLFYPGYIGGGVNNLYRINTTTGLATLVGPLAAGEYDCFSVMGSPPAAQPQYYNYNTTGSTNSFPFNIATGKQIQLLFLPGDFAQPSPAPAGNITSVSFRLAANLGPYTYSQMVIKMGQTDITTFPTGVWYTGQLDTVYYRASVSLGGLANEWMTISLDRPFAYNPARSLVIDVQQCGAPGATGFSSGYTSLAGFRRNVSPLSASCPFSWGGQNGYVHHMGVNITPGTTYNVPELLYFTFENSSTGFMPNTAIPGVGTNPAPYTGTISSGGQFDSALVGASVADQGVTTGWNLNVGARSWTIGMWVQIPTSTSGSAFYLFGDPGSGLFRSFHNGIAGPDNLIFRGTGIIDVTVTGIGPAPTFVHIVYDSATATIKAYKNGVLANTVVQAAPLNIVTGTGFKAGGYSTSANFAGLMDEFRFYSRALDALEIQRTWNHTLPYIFTTGVEPPSQEIPVAYELAQNYPNPFNPTTTIQYGLPAAANVTLKIYNILGQEIVTLVNEQKSPGTYQAIWNSHNSAGAPVASGVYFYSLVARSANDATTFTNIKKMLFLK